jgi:hypothetical protein
MPGEYGDHNLLDLNDATAIFRKFTVVDGCVTGLDLNLLPKTPAVGTGNSDEAPATDITGAERTVPFDLGAYIPVVSPGNNHGKDTTVGASVAPPFAQFLKGLGLR